MKKILTSVLLSFLFILDHSVQAQTTHPFELGFNLGASWQQSDIKMKKLGGGGGFTFGQMYLQDDQHALDWGWRFRYLNAINYGQDKTGSYGIQHNAVLNGLTDSTTDYYNNGGYVYQNHKTTLNECSLELVIGANRLRNNHKVYPYIFGGLGITKAVAKTNLLDADGKRYDYVALDSSGASVNDVYDGSYESYAEGSANAKWKFMPSLGVGLGYQVSPGFSIGLEHKMTWALSDQIDGQQWANDNSRSTTNDKYHYSSVWLKFTFGKRARPVTTTTTDNTITNTTVVPAADKPTIRITNPSASPYTSATQSYTVKATINGVNSRNDVALNYNGVNNTNFNYDAVTHQFTFPVLLLSGNNSFMITATNANGSVTDNATVIYQDAIVVPPSNPAPVVTITAPTANPYTTGMSNVNVNATILNVSNASQVGVTINGVATSAFIFNPSSHSLNISTNVIAGANTFVISAVNSAGSDSKSITVIYSVPVATPPPVVTIVNPAANPFNAPSTPVPVNAIIQNVTSIGQIAVTNNGAPAPTSALSFNPSTGQLSFNANLVPGANSIVVSATNVSGADSKNITIIYTQPVVTVPSPVVTITSPSANPFNTSTNIAAVNATVLNVTGLSQIAVSVNGVPTSAFTYNMSTKQLGMTVNLIPGANVVTITASNTSGSDSKSETIIYNQPAAIPAPVVTITTPSANPYNTSINVETVNASVLNVASSAQISVTVNGMPTTAFIYNTATKQLGMTVSLIAGANVVTISASNASGSDSKSETIIYTQPVSIPAPVVTISSPGSNPYNTTLASATVYATVLNITTSSQIAVTLNGAATSAFTYNAPTKQFLMNVSLMPGANVLTITATNASGSDSKTQTIIYSQPVVVPAPVVSITSPTANPFNTTVSSATVLATVLNVTSASQINVSANGVSTTAFTYNTASNQLSYNASLVAGGNIITITATNASGSDSKSITIVYTAPVVLPAPVVTITTPATATSATNAAVYAVEGTVLNVSSSANITVKVNGASIMGFTYNAATKKLKFNATMIAGANTIVVTATNTVGSDSKTVTITYMPIINPLNPDSTNTPGNPGNHGTGVGRPPREGGTTGGTPAAGSPTISLTVLNPMTVSSATAMISATVNDVTLPSDIEMKVNGVPTLFSYNNRTKTLTATIMVNMGSNTVTIKATNSLGSRTETLTVIRN